MLVQKATMGDIPSWLSLAREVEDLFGSSMADDTGFQQALHRTVERGGAFCIRENDGRPGTALMGGILFSGSHPNYRIGWLAVAEKWRKHGVGHALVGHVISLIESPATVSVTTFHEDEPGGIPARRLYESMGFVPGEVTESHGMPRQEFKKIVRK